MSCDSASLSGRSSFQAPSSACVPGYTSCSVGTVSVGMPQALSFAEPAGWSRYAAALPLRCQANPRTGWLLGNPTLMDASTFRPQAAAFEAFLF